VQADHAKQAGSITGAKRTSVAGPTRRLRELMP
jgi:hypothetical protein